MNPSPLNSNVQKNKNRRINIFEKLLQIIFYNTATLLITGLALPGLFMWFVIWLFTTGVTPPKTPDYSLGDRVEIALTGDEGEILGSICGPGRHEIASECAYNVRLPDLSMEHFNESELRKK